MRIITIADKPYNLHNLTDVIYTGRSLSFSSSGLQMIRNFSLRQKLHLLLELLYIDCK